VASTVPCPCVAPGDDFTNQLAIIYRQKLKSVTFILSCVAIK
jgi:hypothetical protein